MKKFLMIQVCLLLSMHSAPLCALTVSSSTDTITPYKYTDTERYGHMPVYKAPLSSRFTVPRLQQGAPNITCYMSVSNAENYPIVIACGGSSNRYDLLSIIHFHRYFLQEFMDLSVCLVTVDQWGVDDIAIDVQEFMDHYTRSQRLEDHVTVVEYLKLHPPVGWNGKFIFWGVSEGGVLVTALTTCYADITLATVNWVGAGDWDWRQELWAFIEGMKKDAPWWLKARIALPRWAPFAIDFPKSRQEYDARMNETLTHPCTDREFMGMTYKYHADALQILKPDYHKIVTPFLVVAGACDTIIQSCDAFVLKAQECGCPITYFRIEDMDHFIRKRPEIIDMSFKWLQDAL